MGFLKIFNVLSRGILVKDQSSGTPAAPLAFTQGDAVTIEFMALQPATGASTPWEIVDPSAQTPYISLCTLAGTQLAYANSWTVDTSNQVRVGTLAQDSGAMSTALSAAVIGTPIDAYLEIKVVDSASQVITSLAPVKVSLYKRSFNPGTATAPISPEVAATQSWTANSFVPKQGLPGDGIVLVSPSGNRYFFSVDNDGTLQSAPLQ